MTDIQKMILFITGFIVCASVCFAVLIPIILSGFSGEGRLVPEGGDVIGSIGRYHQINEWEKKTGEKALWNPYAFSGMPRYMNIADSFFDLLMIVPIIGMFIYIYFTEIKRYDDEKDKS